MKHDTKSRKYLLTRNNSKTNGVTHDTTKEELHSNFKSLKFYCMADEIASTYHTHLYVEFSSQVRFSQIKKHFPKWHIDKAKGTSSQNRDYVFKIGKWADTEKATTNLSETRFEWGEFKEDAKKQSSTFALIYQMIKDGYSTDAILDAFPSHFIQHDHIEKMRQKFLYKENREKLRPVFVVYIAGKTGRGKTRLVTNKNHLSDVYKVTDYKHPFDKYTHEPVLMLDEFRSSLDIGQMLQLLDIYPYQMPARYAQKIACFDTVYITSNLPLSSQFMELKYVDAESINAFRRRIHLNINFDEFSSKYDTFEETFYHLSKYIDLKHAEHLNKFYKAQEESQKRLNELKEKHNQKESSKPVLSMEEFVSLVSNPEMSTQTKEESNAQTSPDSAISEIS